LSAFGIVASEWDFVSHLFRVYVAALFRSRLHM
jgi:hypothetical protein